MMPRPAAESRQIYSACRLLIVVIFLQNIGAQPNPYRRFPAQHLGPEGRTHHPVFEYQHGPPAPCDCVQTVTVPEKARTPQLVFFPYTVPVPWPTPFNGTHGAPVPTSPRAVIPPSIPPSDDTYPLYIPLPQFEYVPLYYNIPSPVPPKPSLPTPCPPVIVSPQVKPEPKPVIKPPRKPIPEGKSIQILPPAKSPPTKIPVLQPPTNPQHRPLDPICDNQPPPSIISPPKHTWVPPPENSPDYIPQPPSILHPRSSVSHYAKPPQDSITFGPEYFTVSDDTSTVTYGPETYTYYSPDPNSAPYNPYRNRPRYDPNNLGRIDQDPSVTYGPEIQTYTEPSREGLDDDYVTYGPNIVTTRRLTEDAPVPISPKRPPPSRADRPPSVTYGSDIVTYTEPSRDSLNDGYVTYGPNVVTITEDAPVPTNPKQPPPSRADRPPSVTYGPDIVTYTEPSRDSLNDGYVTYGPNVVTITEDTPVPTNPTRSPAGQADRPPYVTYGPDIVTYTDPPRDSLNDGYVTYGPNVVTITEDAPVPTNPTRSPPGRADRPAYVTYGPDTVTYTEPPRDSLNDGDVTYGPNVVTITEDAPVPTNPKRPPPSHADRPPSVTYGPDIVTYTEPSRDGLNDGYVTYGPNVVTITEDMPVPTNPTRSPPGRADRPPYITYGPDIITYTEPPRDSLNNGDVTYGPNVVTITEDAPVPTNPKRPSPSRADRPPSVTYGPDIVTYTEPSRDSLNDGYVTYGPNVVTITKDTPVPTNPTRSPPGRANRPTYVTYGPDIVTYTEPSREGLNDGYVTYGPNVVTITEDAPVSTNPTRSPPGRADRPPYVTYGPDIVTYTEPSRDGLNDGDVRYGPNIVTITEDSPVPTRSSHVPNPARPVYQINPRRPPYRVNPPPAPRSSPSAPQPVNLGGRPSVSPAPGNPSQYQYVYYGPNVYTIAHDGGKQARPPSSPPPFPPAKQPVTIGGRSSAFGVPEEPVQERKQGYVYHDPVIYRIVEGDDGEGAVIFEPEIVRFHEDERHVAEEHSVENPNVTYIEEQPGYYTFTDPEGDSVGNAPIDAPQGV